MNNIHFDWKTLTFSADGLTMDNFAEVPSKIMSIIKNPSSNIVGALLILAIIIVFIIVVALTVISWLSRPKKPVLVESYLMETEDLDEEGNPVEVLVEQEIGLPKDPSRKYYVAITFILMIAVMWVVTGITTQVKPVCVSCHVNDPHVQEMANDPHEKARCVQCHEDNGVIGTVTTAVPVRLAHIVVGTFKKTDVPGYPSFPSRSCANCHGDVVKKGALVRDEVTGVKVSHYEPDQAGIPCAECHILDPSNNKVTATTTGMRSCTTCHNDQIASATCSDCHGRGEKIVASTGPSPKNAQNLVNNQNANQRCYECHDPAPCDSCHGGIRMPHSGGYAAGGEQHIADAQRYGVSACYTCHNKSGGSAGPCSECHSGGIPGNY